MLVRRKEQFLLASPYRWIMRNIILGLMIGIFIFSFSTNTPFVKAQSRACPTAELEPSGGLFSIGDSLSGAEWEVDGFLFRADGFFDSSITYQSDGITIDQGGGVMNILSQDCLIDRISFHTISLNIE